MACWTRRRRPTKEPLSLKQPTKPHEPDYPIPSPSSCPPEPASLPREAPREGLQEVLQEVLQEDYVRGGRERLLSLNGVEVHDVAVGLKAASEEKRKDKRVGTRR